MSEPLALQAPVPHRPGFLDAVRGLPDNPLLRREWLGLKRQMRDWRLWVGVRIPRDARGWGLPAVAWCFILPYGLWAVLHTLIASLGRGYGVANPLPPAEMPDILLLCFLLVGLYVCLAAVGLMAPAIVREREQETWDALRGTAASPHEILLGLLVGRLGPMLAAYAAVALFWLVTLPGYAPLYRTYAPFRLSGGEFALLLLEVGMAGLVAGVMALSASARCRSSAVALFSGLGWLLAYVMSAGAIHAVVRSWWAAPVVLVFSLIPLANHYRDAFRRLSEI